MHGQRYCEGSANEARRRRASPNIGAGDAAAVVRPGPAPAPVAAVVDKGAGPATANAGGGTGCLPAAGAAAMVGDTVTPSPFTPKAAGAITGAAKTASAAGPFPPANTGQPP